jgi:hypothetical protein
MTREDAIYYLQSSGFSEEQINTIEQAFIPKPCTDAISRQAVLDEMYKRRADGDAITAGFIKNLPPVTPQPKMKRCKDCRYFEYDSWANVDGIPLIVAHEICSKWGERCKTREDGYCFLFEPQERESK